MRFLLRFLLVLTVAVVSGLALYYAVQALPTISSGPAGIRLEPQSAGNSKEDPTSQAERPEGNGGGIRWRSLVGVAGKTAMFSILVFISVIAERIIFRKTPFQKRKTD